MSSHPSSSVVPVTQSQGGVKKTDRLLRWVVVALLIVSIIVTTAYTALSIYIATQLVYKPQTPIYATPASLGLQFKYVTFPKPNRSGAVKRLVYTRGIAQWESDIAANHYHGTWNSHQSC